MKIAKVLKDFPCDGGFLAIDEKHEMTGRTIEKYLVDELIEPHRHPRFFYIEERPDGPWKPKPGETYFFIGSTLVVYRDPGAGWLDKSAFDGGNCYQTEAEALAHVPAVRRAYQGKTLREVIESKFPHANLVIEHAALQIIAAWEAR
jgi:hypothetical protein